MQLLGSLPPLFMTSLKKVFQNHWLNNSLHLLRVLRDFIIFLSFKVIVSILSKHVTVLIKNYLSFFFSFLNYFITYYNFKLHLSHFHIFYLIGTVVEYVIMSFLHVLSSWMYICIKTKISKFCFSYLEFL